MFSLISFFGQGNLRELGPTQTQTHPAQTQTQTQTQTHPAQTQTQTQTQTHPAQTQTQTQTHPAQTQTQTQTHPCFFVCLTPSVWGFDSHHPLHPTGLRWRQRFGPGPPNRRSHEIYLMCLGLVGLAPGTGGGGDWRLQRDWGISGSGSEVSSFKLWRLRRLTQHMVSCASKLDFGISEAPNQLRCSYDQMGW